MMLMFVVSTACGGNAEEQSSGTGGTTAVAAGGTTATGSGGATSVGGSSRASEGRLRSPSSNPAMTAGCPIWPIEKTVPWVGMFFYGPNPGPCKETWTGKTSQSVFVYDAQGRVTNLTDGSAQYEYVYDGVR
ncbi:MAG: hypothetical protein QM784_34765 [Polyangiaceae bacterium]